MTTVLSREVSPLSFKRGSLHLSIGRIPMVTLGDTSKINPLSRRECVALSLSKERLVTLRLLAQLSPSVTEELDPRRIAQPSGDSQIGRNIGDKTGTARNDAL